MMKRRVAIMGYRGGSVLGDASLFAVRHGYVVDGDCLVAVLVAGEGGG